MIFSDQSVTGSTSSTMGGSNTGSTDVGGPSGTVVFDASAGAGFVGATAMGPFTSVTGAWLPGMFTGSVGKIVGGAPSPCWNIVQPEMMASIVLKSITPVCGNAARAW